MTWVHKRPSSATMFFQEIDKFYVVLYNFSSPLSDVDIVVHRAIQAMYNDHRHPISMQES